MSTLPPERDLPAATRTRQRHELMAIVDHESAGPRGRRLFAPLAAAAAIVLVVGAAIVVPALRSDKSAAPAGHATPTAALGVRTVFEPLDAAAKAALMAKCIGPVKQDPPAKALDGWRVVNPPENAAATSFVVLSELHGWSYCGFGPKGNRVGGRGPRMPGQAIHDPIEDYGRGSGAYVKGVARVTVTPLGGKTYEAELRHGFYFTSVPEVPFISKRTDSTPLEYVIRAYDGNGKLMYTSPRTVAERRARQARCVLDPTGKTYLAWSGPVLEAAGDMSTDHPAPGMPDPKTCQRALIWNWLP
jgi:hypothetical protein